MGLKQLLVGRPIDTAEAGEHKLSKPAALTVFASDNLSSAAYATEEMLLALTTVGAAALYLTIPAAILIVALLWIIITSYSQTLHAYPLGGERIR